MLHKRSQKLHHRVSIPNVDRNGEIYSPRKTDGLVYIFPLLGQIVEWQEQRNSQQDEGPVKLVLQKRLLFRLPARCLMLHFPLLVVCRAVGTLGPGRLGNDPYAFKRHVQEDEMSTLFPVLHSSREKKIKDMSLISKCLLLLDSMTHYDTKMQCRQETKYLIVHWNPSDGYLLDRLQLALVKLLYIFLSAVRCDSTEVGEQSYDTSQECDWATEQLIISDGILIALVGFRGKVNNSERFIDEPHIPGTVQGDSRIYAISSWFHWLLLHSKVFALNY